MSGPDGHQPPERSPSRGRRTRRAAAAARAHWLFLAFLLAGLLLRVAALVAYRPAMFTVDSLAYLEMSDDLAPTELHPAGYPVFLAGLRALTGDASLMVVPFAQHLLGLGAAVLLYAVQLRVEVPRWLAALAVAPLLLDAYWINLEQYLMSEALALALVVVACSVLLWRRPLGMAAAAAAALAIGLAATTRTITVLLLVPALVCVLVLAAKGTRVRTVLVFVVAAALPLAAYAAWFRAEHGRYALSGQSSRYLYGRVATFVDCSTLSMPAEQRRLCPREPLGDRWNPNYYVWFAGTPYKSVPRDSRERLAGEFARRAIREQPLRYARVVARDVVRGFALLRESSRSGEALWRWQFQPRHPFFSGTRDPPFTSAVLCGEEQPGSPQARSCAGLRAQWRSVVRTYGDDDVALDATLASWLAGYRRFAFVPGPVAALLLLAGAVGAVVAAHRRSAHLFAACFLFTATAAILMVAPVATLHFSWRYTIFAFALMPLAGAFGITALTRDRTPEAPDAVTGSRSPLGGSRA